MARRPIPEDVSHAFGEAVIALVQWRGGSDEPVASLDGKQVPISFLFDLVAGQKFTDPLPPGMMELLHAYAARDREREKEIAVLALASTYEVAARCLLKWAGYKRSKLGK